VAASSRANNVPGRRPPRGSSAVDVPVAKRSRRRWWTLSAIVVLAVVAGGLGVVRSAGRAGGAHIAAMPAEPLPLGPPTAVGALRSPGSGGAAGPEGVPVPAGPPLAAPRTTNEPIDGIACSVGEQVAFHVHAHLTLFVNGVAQKVPAAVGIADPQAQDTAQGQFVGSGSCFYWLHTHAADGIIHVESPAAATYGLGQFFDIWGESLGPDQAGPATGAVTAFYNGQHWTGSLRDIPLNAHAQIQLDVGSPLVAPASIRFPGGL
jgi:hypothetical protein